jgi:sucrose-6-phosphate hydrolase SacC (GH32 family)
VQLFLTANYNKIMKNNNLIELDTNMTQQQLYDLISSFDTQNTKILVLNSRKNTTTTIPSSRLKNIALFLSKKETKTVVRKELVDFFISDGLSVATANVYISGALKRGILEKKCKQYILTQLGVELADG